ncbi:MAG: hypothetical protein AAFY02_01950 [Pseudomonadota bacterium]
MTLDLTTVVDNVNLPTVLNLKDLILAQPSLVEWFQADALSTTPGADSGIESLNSLTTAAGVLSQPDTEKQAALVSSAIGAFSALKFDKTDFYTWTGPNPATAYTWALVLKRGDPTENQAVFGTRNTPGDQSHMRFRTGMNISYYHGSAVLTQTTPDGWLLGVFGHDANAAFTGGTAYLSVNGSPYLSEATDNKAGTGEPYLLGALSETLSQPFDGEVSDIWMFDVAPLLAEKELSLVKDYCEQVYGIPIEPLPRNKLAIGS